MKVWISWVGRSVQLVGILLLMSQAAIANEAEVQETEIISSSDMPHLNGIEQPATTLDQWHSRSISVGKSLIAQASVVQITGVRLDSADGGIELILETAGELTAPKTSVTGNALIVEIPNAVLALSDGEEFLVAEPAEGIARVNVTNLPNNQVRVTITGVNAPPATTVSTEAQRLVLSVTSKATTAEDDDTIEVVVTGEREDSSYFAPDASTATRTDTPILDVPQSIQVIPRQVLEDQQVIRLEEALRNVSGIMVGGSNEGQGLVIDIRGFQGAPVLLDGFRQYGQGEYQSILETANLEQIKVLKGPASILYGEIEPGGVINLVSKRPLSEPFYEAELQIGSRSLFCPRIDFSGPLTADGELLYRLNALFLNQEPFRDFDTNFQRAFVAPTLTWKISDRTELTFQMEYLYNNQPADFGRVASGDRVLDTPRDRITGEPGDYTESRIVNVGYNFEHRFNDNLTLRNAFRYISRGFFQELAFPLEFDPATGIITRNFGGFDEDTESYSLQTNVVGNLATGSVRHTLLFGVDLNRTTDRTFGAFDFDNSLLLDIFNPVYGSAPRPDFRDFPPLSDEEVTQNRLGIYLQDQVDFLDNLKLLAGLRYDTVDQKTQNGVTLSNPDSSEVNQNDDALTPRVGCISSTPSAFC